MSIPSYLEGFEEAECITSADFVCGERTILHSVALNQILQLTTAGVERLRTDADFRHLLAAVSAHVVDAEVQDAARWLPGAISGSETLKTTNNPDRFHVYTAGAPHDIVMRIGGYCTEAQVQFDVMSWLHGKLQKSESMSTGVEVRSPEQYALLQSGTHLSIGFMERVYGTALWTPDHWPKTEAGLEAAKNAALQYAAPVAQHLETVIGKRYMGLLNDIGQSGHVANILVDTRWRYNIIDQPNLVRRSTLAELINQDSALLAFRALLGERAYSRYVRTFGPSRAS